MDEKKVNRGGRPRKKKGAQPQITIHLTKDEYKRLTNMARLMGYRAGKGTPKELCTKMVKRLTLQGIEAYTKALENAGRYYKPVDFYNVPAEERIKMLLK